MKLKAGFRLKKFKLNNNLKENIIVGFGGQGIHDLLDKVLLETAIIVSKSDFLALIPPEPPVQ